MKVAYLSYCIKNNVNNNNGNNDRNDNNNNNNHKNRLTFSFLYLLLLYFGFISLFHSNEEYQPMHV